MARNGGPDLLLVGSDLDRIAAAAAKEGLTVETVASPLAAVSRARLRPPRVVVLSGADLAGREDQAIAALREDPSRPSVLLTIPPRPSYRREAPPGVEADETIEEPCLPDRVLEGVRRLLDRRAAERAAKSDREAESAAAYREALDDLATLNALLSDVESLKRAIFEAFLRRSAARRASLLLLQPQEPGKSALVLDQGEGLPKEVELGTLVAMEGTLSGRVAATGRPLLVTDIRQEDHPDLRSWGTYRTQSCLSFPLVAADRVMAVVNLADKSDDTPFHEGDLRRHAVFAEHAGQVLANALQLERMTRLSILDDLTGLYNRRFFRRSLDREFRRAERYERPVTLAILDLDHFKVLNDKNGHETGNRVLRKVGEILRSSFRNTDIVARYGGEEFAVIFPETEKGAPAAEGESGTTGAYQVLERLRVRIAETDFGGEEHLPGGTLTISGGAASYPADAKTLEELLDAADAALYSAKRQGRDRILLA